MDPVGIHHIAAKERPRGSDAVTIQGILGPHLDFVLSLNHPIKGSLIASHILISMSNEPAIITGKPAEQIKNLNKKKPNFLKSNKQNTSKWWETINKWRKKDCLKFKNNKEIMKLAVQNNGTALMFASKTLQDDKNIVELDNQNDFGTMKSEDWNGSKLAVVHLEQALIKMKNNLNNSRKKNEIMED